MERIIFVLFGFFAVSLSQPLQSSKDSEVSIVKYHNERTLDGYSFNYELSDGQEREETGVYKDGKDVNGVDIKVLTVTGHFSFIAPSGEKFTTFYVADENGYRVQKMMSEAIEGRSLVSVDTESKEDDEDDDAEMTTTVADTQ
ncbi:hypothetical protein PVAND_009510 [Polypedilum vanderplanki]|uniref:Uncharacterized protein n=1 Tax=Polypedilum vanderplanki TaxID=319348 RepID=A0A9J6CDD9_POLVA|nr:hypothetical protein PVAND_009510 [Polypedilum vanderplanki]